MLHCTNSIYGDSITRTFGVCKKGYAKTCGGICVKYLPELKLEPSKMGINF